MWLGLTIMLVMCVGLIVWILYAMGVLSKKKDKKDNQVSWKFHEYSEDRPPVSDPLVRWMPGPSAGSDGRIVCAWGGQGCMSGFQSFTPLPALIKKWITDPMVYTVLSPFRSRLGLSVFEKSSVSVEILKKNCRVPIQFIFVRLLKRSILGPLPGTN